MNHELVSSITSKLFSADVEIIEDSIDTTRQEQYWLIPGSEGIRWVLPYIPTLAWKILKQWQPYNISSRLKWFVLIVAYRLRVLKLIPRVQLIAIKGSIRSNWEHIGFKSKRGLIPVIYVGTPGPTRKAVVTLVDPCNAEIAGIAKIPLGQYAINGVMRESSLLQKLEKEKPGIAPKLFFINPEQGISLQQVVIGHQTGRKLTKAHIDYLIQLHKPGKSTSLKEHTNHLSVKYRKIKHKIKSDICQLIESAIDELKDSFLLPDVWIHGDFVPWNIMRSSEGKLVCVDWEDASVSGLPLQDMFNFFYMQKFLFSNNDSILSSILDNKVVLDYLRRINITEGTYRRLAIFYLVDSLVEKIDVKNMAHSLFLAKEIKKIINSGYQ